VLSVLLARHAHFEWMDLATGYLNLFSDLFGVRLIEVSNGDVRSLIG